MFLDLDRRQKKSLQEQIVDQICSQIVSGALKPGTRLPSSRDLACMLGVSRNTVSFAYDRLLAEGYLTARRGARTCVSDKLPDSFFDAANAGRRAATGDAAADQRLSVPSFSVREPVVFRAHRMPIDFWVPQADPRSFPLKIWKRLLSECLSDAGWNLTNYGDPSGLKELKCAIADQVARSRGIVTTPEAVFITAGAQLALNTVARLFLRGGERVVVENPCNQGAAYLFESYGTNLIPVPLDNDGLITAQLPMAPISLAYVTPSHQYPLGMRLSLERRKQLLSWADVSGAYIIEDDYDGHFTYEGQSLPALKALRDDRVIYLGTFSKALGAGLRIGYAIFPSQLIETTRAAKALLDNGQAWLEQAVLAKFIQRGSFDRHIRLIRRIYLARRDRLVSQLMNHFGDISLTGTLTGTHVAWHLPYGYPSALEIQEMAQRRGVGVYTVEGAGGHEFGEAGISERVLLLGFGSLTERQIDNGVARLAARLKELPLRRMPPATPRAVAVAGQSMH